MEQKSSWRAQNKVGIMIIILSAAYDVYVYYTSLDLNKINYSMYKQDLLGYITMCSYQLCISICSVQVNNVSRIVII